MSDRWDFDVNCWYMSNDNNDLFAIHKEGPAFTAVFSFTIVNPFSVAV